MEDQTTLTPAELAAQIESVEQQEKALAPIVEVPTDQRMSELEAENARLSKLIQRAVEARTSIVGFMNRWNDPRRMPDLVHELRTSHPDIQKIAKEVNPATADQASKIMAHIAVAFQIEALINGMIYAWTDNGKLIVEIGYRGYAQMLMQRGIDWQTPRPMTDSERDLHGLKPGDCGAVVEIRDWSREDRFKQHGEKAAPILGVGIWRAVNLRGKTDNIANGRSAQWMAEKNAVKAGARFALPMPMLDVAMMKETDLLDATFDQDSGAWSVAVARADWLEKPDIVAKFLSALSANGITTDELNIHLGHDWQYTGMDREAMREKVNELIAQKAERAETEFAGKLSPLMIEVPGGATPDFVVGLDETGKPINIPFSSYPKTSSEPKPAPVEPSALTGDAPADPDDYVISMSMMEGFQVEVMNLYPDLQFQRQHAVNRVFLVCGVDGYPAFYAGKFTRSDVLKKLAAYPVEKDAV